MGGARASPLERIAPAAIKRIKNLRRCIGSNQCFPTSATAEVRSGFVLFFAPPRYYTMLSFAETPAPLISLTFRAPGPDTSLP